MTRWEALIRYDPEIRVAATQLMPFGSNWVDRLGEAFAALNEDRRYLPNIVAELVKEAEHLEAQTWLRAFSKTQDGHNISKEALEILIGVQASGGHLIKEADGTIAASLPGRGTSYLRSSADVVRFAQFAFNPIDPDVG
jgi:hypothetical protein